MTTERIDIQVREDGSRVVARNLTGIGSAADKSHNSVLNLKSLLLSIGGGAAVTGLARIADQYTNMQNRLRLVTSGTQNLADTTAELLKISNETRQDFGSVADLYSRVALSAKELGTSQRDLMTFTKGLNQAIVLSGASAQEASAGLIQLSQGIASGTLRGDELRSVLEQLPAVADVIAQHLGVTRGELRALGTDGKITAQQVIEAFVESADVLEKRFGTTIPTLGQAFQVLKNNITSYVGELNNSYGITAGLAKLIITLGENLNTLVPILTGVGVAIALAFAPGIIEAFIAQVRLLWLTISLHPIGALITVLGGLITALILMRDQLKLGIDDYTTLGDLMRATWEGLAPLVEAVTGTLEQVWINFVIFFEGTFGTLKGSASGFGDHTEGVFIQMVRVVARVVDAILGLFIGMFEAIKRQFNALVEAAANSGSQIKNIFEAVVFSPNLDTMGKEIKKAVASSKNGWMAVGQNLGENLRAGMDIGFGAMKEGGFESQLDAVLKRAKELGKERLAENAKFIGFGQPGTTPHPPKPPVDDDAAKKAARELEKLKNALANVMDEADPLGAAYRHLAEAQDILTRSVQKHLITEQEAAQIYAQLAERMKDQLDPLGALNREIDQNIKLLKLSSREREIEAQMYQMTEGLKRDGVNLTVAETNALRAKLIVEQELTRIAQMRDQLEQQGTGRRLEDFKNQVEAMKQLLADVKSGFTEGDAFSQVQEMLPWADLSNTQSQMNAYVELHREMYAQIKALEDANVLNHENAALARAQADVRYNELRLQSQRNFFSTLATLSSSGNKKLAAIGKAAAATTAIIDGIVAVQKAWSSAPYPYNIPMVVATAAATAANVAAIMSQGTNGFRTGGSMTVGGSGGPDSQLVQFRATPGEKVNINTPSQDRALRNGNVGGTTVVQPKIIVVQSMEEAMEEYLASPKGEAQIVTINQRNGGDE